MTFPPGTKVERYTVLHRIGAGGMATVYAVRHDVLGTRHALKVLHTPLQGAVERFLTEGRLQATLASEHVVPVRDAFAVGETAALVLPLIEGCSLDALLARHRPTVDEAMGLFAGIVEGVCAAHAAGVVHRDLKPANVLLEVRRGRVVPKVADFGVAKVLHSYDAGQTIGFLGTPAYAAPEQWEHAAAVDHRADLWSLGVMLFELLVGRRPFDAGEPDALLAKASAGAWDRQLVVDTWRPLVESLLQPEPDARPSSAPAVRDALEAIEALPALAATGPLATAIRSESVGPDLPQTVYSGVAHTTPPVTPSHNLPAERSSFVGRTAHLDTLAALCQRAHLISLTGPAGTGKTRLALRHAHRSRQEWSGGGWLCDVREARDVPGIAAAMAHALRVGLRGGEPVAQVGDALAGLGRCLVIVDNFEHLVPHAQATLGAWVQQAPQAVFVVTTRERLAIEGERVITVEPLSPEDAVELFVARARMAVPAFTVDDDEQLVLQQLVATLDHLPLAIELAAARIRIMSVSSLLGRLSDRFQLLARPPSASGGSPTLRAALDWSWELLSVQEQSGLAQLSVFEGTFDLEAVEAVVDVGHHWSVDVLQRLVDKSMVQVGEEERFGLLMSVRDYAAEALETPEAEAAHRRHGAHYARMGRREAMAEFRRHGIVGRRRALAREYDNLAAACRRASARGDAEVAVGTLRALWAMADMRGTLQALVELARAAVATVPPDTALEADAQLFLANSLRRTRQTAAALEPARRALAITTMLDDPGRRGNIHASLGLLYIQRADWDAAEHHVEQALKDAIASGDRGMEGRVHGNHGLLHIQRGRPAEALEEYRVAVQIHREVGDLRNEGTVLGNISGILLDSGNVAEASRNAQAALELARRVGNRWSECFALTRLVTINRRRGDSDSALRCALQAEAVARRAGMRTMLAEALNCEGLIHAERGDVADARRAYGEALEIAIASDYWSLRWIVRMNLGVLEHNLGDHEAALRSYAHALQATERASSERGRCLILGNQADSHAALHDLDTARDELDEAIRLATALRIERFVGHWMARRASVILAQGHLDDAERQLERSLEILQQMEDRAFLAQALAQQAELHHRRGRTDQAQHTLARARDTAPSDHLGTQREIARVAELMQPLP